MRVSVVIPTYNRKHLLAQCITSILRQTYSALEVHVIDDASTDGTDSVVKNFNDPRIIYHNNGKVANISELRNIGIAASTGDLIALCDDDDMWMADKLKIQMEHIQNYDLVCSNASVINKEGRDLGRLFHNNIQTDFVITPEELIVNNHIITSSVLVKNFFFQNQIMFDAAAMASSSEDYDLWLKLLINYNAKMFFVNKPLIKYRLHDNLTYRKNNYPIVYKNSIKIVSKYSSGFEEKIMRYSQKGRLRYKISLAKLYFNYKQFFNTIGVVISIIWDFKRKYFLQALLDKLLDKGKKYS